MRILIYAALFFCSFSMFAQQIAIPRIELMPDFPQPYEMRNWKHVAEIYDSLVYNEYLSGQHLPLIEITDQSINYPDHPSYGLHSYVGTGTPEVGEAINVLPSVIGATLCGIDKSMHYGKNWVLWCEEYFNKASGENVYLNNTNGHSGHDWWYETMPNIFFYQLNDLYPNTGDFEVQFKSVANSWYEAVKAMGGGTAPWKVPEMTFRAWDLNLMEPLTEGVPEPEAAGAIAWILYCAFQQTGNTDWREAAEWCMEYLNGLETNPSYELQLSYGVYTAARMNAEIGTKYNVEKMLNWCFDIGPLRNWGAVLGTWGELDCDGLIGEQSEGETAYAFAMNGFQQAAALLPVVRYDDRYAKALGKWMLNLANASRLFYAKYLPIENQDAPLWTALNDPESVIAYEGLKETFEGKAPFSTGDAMKGGWAETNLALYGSSHVGMLGALISKTNVEGILQLDLLKTDFYHDEAHPTYLYYNPFPESKVVKLDLDNNPCDIYESTTNQFLAYKQTGQYLLHIPASQARVIVLVPAGSEISYRYEHTLAGDLVIDYFNGRVIENSPPRIKSLASTDSLVLINTDHQIFCTAEDRDSDHLLYKWSGQSETWGSDSILLWKAPETPGYYDINCGVIDAGGLQDSSKITMHVVDLIVRDSSNSQREALVLGLNFDENAEDFSSHHNNGLPNNIFWDYDRKGESGKAAGFNGTSSMIRITNEDYLNFTDGLSLTCWIKPIVNAEREQFIISHGSWQNRYKLSINNNYLRFTIKTSAGIMDLDSKTELKSSTWQHWAVVYNGRDMIIYLNNELDSFLPWSGKLKITSFDLSIGQMLPDNSAYNFEGVMDDVRIFNYGLDEQAIAKIFNGEILSDTISSENNHFTIFPNPAHGSLTLVMPAKSLMPDKIWITASDGKLMWTFEEPERFGQNNRLSLPIGQLNTGIYYIWFIDKGLRHSQKLVIF